MSDEQSQTEAPLANATEARTPTGEIKDQSTPSTEAAPPKTESPKPTLAAQKPVEGAPETYADFKAPEGYEIDKASIAEALPVFKELGLSQDAAQRLIDIYAKQSVSDADRLMEKYETIRNDWRTTIAKDPALGNGSDNLKPEVAATIGRAIDSLPPEVATAFREAMDLTGAGDNPAFIRAFYHLAQRSTEGRPVVGGNPSPEGQRAPNAPRSAAQAMYPTLPSSAS